MIESTGPLNTALAAEVMVAVCRLAPRQRNYIWLGPLVTKYVSKMPDAPVTEIAVRVLAEVKGRAAVDVE